jgi:hypothetical protein
MMIRNKISFMAFEKGQTLLEFFILKIYETYKKPLKHNPRYSRNMKDKRSAIHLSLANKPV